MINSVQSPNFHLLRRLLISATLEGILLHVTSIYVTASNQLQSYYLSPTYYSYLYSLSLLAPYFFYVAEVLSRCYPRASVGVSRVSSIPRNFHQTSESVMKNVQICLMHMIHGCGMRPFLPALTWQASTGSPFR